MAHKIRILDSLLASKIAAGEVVERPASVVKELIENSLDAGAQSITVHVAEGGKRLIRVIDDGEGMAREDAAIAFLRHSTSKISSEDDLYRIRTMGFRGEALSSISSVARVLMKTRPRGDVSGTAVTVEGGGEPVVVEDGCPEGTSIEVKDLFYSTPARLKFLRSAGAEFGRVMDVFKRAALINPQIRFRLIHGSTRTIDAAPGGERERIADIFGKEILEKIVEVKSPLVKGHIGSHETSYTTSKGLFIYVNGRWIRDKSVNRAVIDGYGTLLPGGRYPFAVLDILVSPEDVDVNIHPAKTEVRFRNQGFIYDIIKAAVRDALAGGRPSVRTEVTGGPAYRGAAYTNGPFASETKAAYSTGRQGVISEGPEENSGEIKNPEFLELDTIGQLWGEFLVAQGRGEFYIIDQHGAAERSAFERLKKRYFSRAEGARQILLIPERFEATPEESGAIGRIGAYLDRFGFEIMPFGPSSKTGGETFLIKAVPDILAGRSASRLIKDLAEELGEAGGSNRAEERVEGALMRIACHSVIRGFRPLSKEEGNALLRDLARIDFAGHCPHGRPVVKRFSRAEIEAIFKR